MPDWLSGITVKHGSVPASLDNPARSGVLWQAAPRRFLLEVPDVARFLIDDGTSMTIDAMPGADPSSIARCARGAPLAALCYQRGIIVLHAAGAVRDDRAVVLAGDSAAGKSTLLAALVRRGWRVLSDDLVPIDLDGDTPVALPVPGEIALWPDAVERLRLSSLAGRDPAGRRLLLPAASVAGPAPVDAIWCITPHGREGVRVDALHGSDAFEGLRNVAYNSRLASALLSRATYLGTAAAIAAAVPIRRVRRPRGDWTASLLADLVETTPYH